MAPRAKCNWLAVRAYYGAGHTEHECANKFGVSVRQVQRHIAEDGWKDDRASIVIDATEKFRQAVALDLSGQLMDHEQFLAWSMGIIRSSEGDLGQIVNPASRIKARSEIMEMVERGIRMSRLVRGMRDGTPSVTVDMPEAPGKTYEVVVVEHERETA